MELIWLDIDGQIMLTAAHLRHLGAAEGDWLILETRGDWAFVLRRRANDIDSGHRNGQREESDPASKHSE